MKILLCIVALLCMTSCVEDTITANQKNSTSTVTMDVYQIAYLGLITINHTAREVIKLYNTETEQSQIMIRGFGVSDSYPSGAED